MRLTVGCAGHPAPVLAHANGAAEVLPCRGTLLGVTEHAELQDHAFALAPGDTAVFYTDGVTEARDDAGELFGEARLLDLLRDAAKEPAATIADRVIAAVRAHSDDDPRDDIALLVVRLPL